MPTNARAPHLHIFIFSDELAEIKISPYNVKIFQILKSYEWFWFKLEYVFVLINKQFVHTQIQTSKMNLDRTRQRFHDAKSFALHRCHTQEWRFTPKWHCVCAYTGLRFTTIEKLKIYLLPYKMISRTGWMSKTHSSAALHRISTVILLLVIVVKSTACRRACLNGSVCARVRVCEGGWGSRLEEEGTKA